jgi:hypothetical protein
MRTLTSAHRTPHTAHRTPHTAHRTPHTAHRTPHTAHGTRHSAHRTRHSAPFNLLDSPFNYLAFLLIHPTPKAERKWSFPARPIISALSFEASTTRYTRTCVVDLLVHPGREQHCTYHFLALCSETYSQARTQGCLGRGKKNRYLYVPRSIVSRLLDN